MTNPETNVGKICTSLEKYYNVQKGMVDVKYRPVLIIGYEYNYNSPRDVDYELLPISRMLNIEPDEKYDVYLDYTLSQRLGLDSPSYIRTAKTTWNHAKRIRLESPIGDLLHTFPELFKKLLYLNQEWVNTRNDHNLNILHGIIG